MSNAGGTLLGYNLYAYCFNNPVNQFDASGSWPRWVHTYVINPAKAVAEFVSDVVEDIKNYDSTNESEAVVFESNYFSNYKGAVVVKTPFDASFSIGFIGLSHKDYGDSDTLNHEHGHFLQLKEKGIDAYITDVVVPSITINIMDRQGKLTYDYYSYPWEAEANKLGNSNASQYWKKPLPQGAYHSYWDLFK